MTTISELLKKCIENDLSLSLRDGKLFLESTNENIPGDLLQELKARKEELTAYFQQINDSEADTTIPIVDRTENDRFPVSSMQERVWFLDQYEEESTTYNLVGLIRIEGKLEQSALEKALQQLMERQIALRTAFFMENDEVYQKIVETDSIPMTITDLQGNDEQDQMERIRQLVKTTEETPFNLSEAPLFKIQLFQLDSEKHILMLAIHHIITDARSMSIFFQELIGLYQASVTGQPARLMELSVQYVDYASWQKSRLSGDNLEKELEYWMDQVADYPTVLELPTDFTRPPQQSYAGNKRSFSIPKTVLTKLKELCQKENVTLFMMLFSAFSVLINRYSGQKKFLIGTPIANRNSLEVENLIGYFANMLLQPVDLSDVDLFSDYLKRVKTMTTDIYDHQEIPFETLVEKLLSERDLSRNPLFQVMFNLRGAVSGGDSPELNSLNIEPIEVESNIAKFDLSLEMDDQGDALFGYMEFSTDLFLPERIERMIDHFQMILEAVANNVNQPIAAIDLLTKEEQNRLLNEWNQTEMDFPKEQPVHTLFEAQVANNPNGTALVFEEQTLTYGELNEAANQLAHYLLKQGVKPGSLIAFCMERSVSMIVTIWAILKAGAAYVPLDPRYPVDRLQYMIEDSGTKLLLTEESLLENLSLPESVQTFAVDSETGKQALAEETTNNPEGVAVTSANSAYVIYTSGTTGKPKGVRITHRNLVNFLYSMKEKPGCTANDTLLSVTTVCFDIFGLELYLPLLSGGIHHLVATDVAMDGDRLLELLESSGATIMQATPVTWNMLLESGWQGKTPLKVLCGGEPIPKKLVHALTGMEKVELWNMYGPTETTVWSTVEKITDPNEKVTIGRPVGNTDIYILDENLAPQPIGVVGEIYIGGEGIAPGYFEREELTDERFIPNPFKQDDLKIYRTGDLGRYLNDGRIECLGREDHQVKIRGFRIELEEIEIKILQHELVRECVVTDKEDATGEKRLIAYLVAEETDWKKLVTEVKEILRSDLPDYMMPSVFHPLEKLPLTGNGKVNRKALPDPDFDTATVAEVLPPETLTESKLLPLWQEVLKIDRIGVSNNFFEWGGHSLMATRLINLIRKELQVELPIRALFEAPTIRELARRIDTSGEHGDVNIPEIKPQGDREQLPLSFAQQRLWFLDSLEGPNSTYNIPAALKLEGPLNVPALEKAINEVVQRHKSLRTVFTEADNGPVQVCMSLEKIDFPIIDLQDNSEEEKEKAVIHWATLEMEKPFQLSKDPMLRARLLQLSEQEHVLLMTMHHIASDGWSIGVLEKEVTTLYQAFNENRPAPLQPLEIQYGDYSAWQREWLQGEVLDEQLAYWTKKLDGIPAIHNLPLDRPRPARQTWKGTALTRTIDEKQLEAVKALGLKNGTTLFMTLQSLFCTLLSRYSNETDIVVGVPIANRTNAALAPLIGFFVNTLALRVNLSDDPTFESLLKQVRQTALESYQYQNIPFESLVEHLQPERSLSHEPIFQIMISLQNFDQVETEVSDLRISPVEQTNQIAKFDLTLNLLESNSGLITSWEYNTDLFDQETINRMADHFELLMDTVVQDPKMPVSQLPLLTDREKEQLLQSWNPTEIENNSEKLIHQLIEEQTEKTPDAVAVVFDQEALTYRELNQKANRLAHFLTQQGVQPETPVGLCMERGCEMIIGMLGIMKAGGAYIPLDPNYPKVRIEYMLNDSQAPILLTQERLLNTLPINDGTTRFAIDQEELREALATQSEQNFDVEGLSNTKLAYMIYTSGSTGQPKGVAIEHKSAVTMIDWAQTVFTKEQLSSVLVSTSICFDLSIFEIFVTLSAGGKAVVVENIFGFREVVDQEKITLINTVPSAIRELIHAEPIPECVKIVNLAGEALRRELVNEVYEQSQVEAVYNLYGPSEDTTYSTYALIEKEEQREPLIGIPVTGTQAYILDQNHALLPIGVPGELYLGGDGLARGYHNRPELTAERFIANPFDENPNSRIYGTGDLVRRLPDGNLEYLGRIDHQVKIRGFRIELGEIEATLLKEETVNECVVVVREEQAGDPRIVAYLSLQEIEEKEFLQSIRTNIGTHLPDYMIPSAFVILEALPQTPNGKVDRKRLPAPDLNQSEEQEFQQPETETEEQLLPLWKEVLKLDRISTTGNFFQLGGHSLLATRLITKIRKEMEIELPLKTLFESPTLRQFAVALELAKQGPTSLIPNIESVADRENLPLSFAQQRLWFLDNLGGESNVYNMPISLKLTGELNLPALTDALSEVIKRHESLRTVFKTENEQPVQKILPPEAATITSYDLRDLPEEEKEKQVEELADKELNRPFKLDRDRMIRASLLRLKDNEHILLMTMHHIASDGWSLGILVHEMSTLYQAFLQGENSPLPPLEVQYADYAVWQRNWLQGEVLDEQVGYWKEQLQGIPQVHNLPLDLPRPPVQTWNGHTCYHHTDPDLYKKLIQLGRDYDVTLFMVLEAAFSTLLSRYSNESDIVLGTIMANRDQSEVAPMIGFFANTLVLRNDLSEDPTFDKLLQTVRTTFLDAQKYGELPFEQLVEALQPERSISYSPLFQVMIVLQNNEQVELQLPGLELSFGGQEANYAKFDLTLNVIEETDTGSLTFGWEYNNDLFQEQTIRRMAEHFEILLHGILEQPKSKVSELPIMTEPEKEKLLVAWNKTEADFPADKCLHELFEQQVENQPQSIALVHEKASMTYEALNQNANRLAHYLRTLGVGLETPVGICMERSNEMVIALLAVIKAGGTYLPIDPTYPKQRLAFMVEDAGIEILLTEENLSKVTEGIDVRKIWLDQQSVQELLASHKETNIPRSELSLTEQNLIYTIYTSGSTGLPKGVMITHQGAVNYLHWAVNEYQVETLTESVVHTSFSFDATVTSLFAPLACGKRIHLVTEGKELETLGEVMKQSNKQLIKITPAHLKLLAQQGIPSQLADDQSVFVIGGEELTIACIEPWINHMPKARFINEYGPTETVVGCCVHEVSVEDLAGVTIPIGLPIANTTLHILDENQQPVPVGVAGELYIGGAGVARGYLNRPELTEERFIQSPFQNEERLYRSGDLARYLADGRIEYLGRIDTQVKVRGFRIELGEIENKLAQNTAVKDCVVIADQDQSGDERLVAYLMAATENRETLIETLKDELRAELPEYMVPSIFMFMDSFPLTGNGKVNRKALPKAEVGAEFRKEFKEPANKLERKILEAWKETLMLESIGTRDNFFDIGGHSLKIVKLRALLEKSLARNVAITKLFEFPTIEQQARYFSSKSENLLLTEKDVRNRLKESNNEATGSGDIAIIGIYGKYPGADSVDAFWENLKEGVESSRKFTDEELLEAGVTQSLLDNPGYVKSKMMIDNIDLFDADFFGYNPKEASVIDPQQRFLLEGGWSLLESAGYTADKYDGWIGVYAGASFSNYFLQNLAQNGELFDSLGIYPLMLGNDKDFLATKLSYHLGLKGPAITVQTACSTSLVATQMAADSLLRKDCDMAIVGAAAIGSPQKEGYLYVENGIASPDGHCRAFDANARGTIIGSGVSMILIKRLEDANQDGDTIHAVIKGGALNNDGDQKVGFTAPGLQGQATAIINALENANVPAETVSYVEAHGTGTQMGDPIEISALTQAYRRETDKKGFCGIGSVKSNVGHLDAAAGLTGLIKTVLALKHGLLPPTVHFQEPNPEIDFVNSPFYVVDQLKEWSNEAGPRRAGISSFGIGGTNAHMILEEAPKKPVIVTETKDEWNLLPLSAKTETALIAAINNLKAHLETENDLNLKDVAYTLQQGRKEFQHRQAVVAKDLPEAIQQLEAASRKKGVAINSGDPVKPVFLFPGQGAQFPNMALELYQQQPLFQQVVDQCCDFLNPILGQDLKQALFPDLYDTVTVEEAAEQLQQTSLTQPALFVIEYALAKLWIATGVEPDAMLGHSVGEYVAAALANVMTPEEAMELLAVRGRLIQSLPQGSMIAVPKTVEELSPMLNDRISLAAHNANRLCVLSGTDEAIDTIRQTLEEQGTSCQNLKTSHAFHSVMMEPILKEFEAEVVKRTFNAPNSPYISNVTGTWITEEDVKDPTYWVKHLRQTVLFDEGVETLLEDENRLYLEVGPGTVLSSLVRQKGTKIDRNRVINSLRHPKKADSDARIFQQAVATSWSFGTTVDWNRLRNNEQALRIPLPTYPFERKRYWVEPTENPLEGFSVRKFRKEFNEWFYQTKWKLDPMLPNTEKQEHSKTWLLFMDELGVGEALKQRLQTRNQDVVAVHEAPASLEEYETVLRDLEDEDRVPSVVVNLQNVTEATELNLDNLPRFQETAFENLILFMKAWGKVNANEPLQLGLVSNHVQKVLGTEQLNPAKSMLLGPALVIPIEFPDVNFHSIDIDWESSAITTNDSDMLIADLLDRYETNPIAYRMGLRFVRDSERIQVRNEDAEKREFKENGVYLITGGLGGIGLTMAETIISAVPAKFVLTGRSEFPERETWEQWLQDHEKKNRVSQKIQRLLALESKGAEVMIVQNDCCDLEDTKKLAAAIKERFGEVNGIIHTAGVPGERMIQFGTIEQYQAEVAPKTVGTCILQEVFSDQPLELFMLCSSINSFIGAHGQSGYCAGNIFLDTFAKNHEIAVAVNWPAWSEVGMAVNMSEDNTLSLEQELVAISPKEGGEVLKWVTNQPQLKNVTVFPVPLEECLKISDQLAMLEEEQAANDSNDANKTLFPRPELSVEYEAPENKAEKEIVSIWQDLLGIDQIGRNDNFFELGGHSLLATMFLSRVGGMIELNDLFEKPTVKELAPLISKAENVEGSFLPELIVDPENRYEPFPMSDVQQAYWVGRNGSFDLGNVGVYAYSERPLPDLDPDRLQKALNRLIQRHEMLKMVITEDGEQKILEQVPEYEIPILDLMGKTEEEEAQLFQEWREKFSHHVFTGSTWPLFDVRVTRFRDGSWKFHYGIDALVMDAGSLRIFLKELLEFYQEPEVEPEPLELTFRDYILSEEALKETGMYERSKTYWTDRVATFPMGPELSLAKAPEEITEHRFTRQKLVLKPKQWKRLQANISKVGVTPTVFLITVFGAILKQWVKTPHFTLNLTLFNRIPFHEQVESIIGDFTTLILLEMNYKNGNTFTEQLKQIQQQLWNDISHKYFSGVEVQRAISREVGKTVTMPVVVTSLLGLEDDQNNSAEAANQEETDVVEELDETPEMLQEYFISQTAQVWIDHQITENNGELLLIMDSVTGLFPEGMLEAMFAAYSELLMTLLKEDEAWQKPALITLPTEQKTARNLANQTETSESDLLMHDLFRNQAAKTPEAIAVQSDRKTLTYGELDLYSNQIALNLREQGAKPNELIAIVMEKGWEQIPSSLGIQIAGSAWLPIDATLPDERIYRLLELGEVSKVLTVSSVLERLNLSDSFYCLAIDQMEIEGVDMPELTSVQKREDLAYVIFTSGSTGEPKGVMIDHRGAVNTILDVNERYQITEQDRALALSALSFDLSVYDIYGLLGAGGAIVIPEEDERRNPEAWLRYLKAHNVTIWNTVPALMQMMVEYAEDRDQRMDLRVVLMSGDWIPVDLPNRIKALNNDVQVISLGGATEASIWSILFPIETVDPRWKSIPYGKPMKNQTFHVLAEDLTNAPDWTPGELYIGGIGLAKGYWKDKEKTDSSFIIHPVTGERLYKTGDLGRYLPDGNIEFLGRNDFQVKVQGYRIELGEIETNLTQHELIRDAVVGTVDVDKNTKQLVAWVVPESQPQEEKEEENDNVGGLASAGNTIVDKEERSLFKMELHGIRKLEACERTIPLAQPTEPILKIERRSAENAAFSDQTIPREQFARLFDALQAKQLEELPLPKYYYPSAGSLYPVQTYVTLREGGVEGMEAGCYYYNPLKHSLEFIAPVKENIAAPFALYFAADSEAIDPLYGKYGRDFSLLEAGYMAQLLESTVPATIAIQSYTGFNVETVTEQFQLKSAHYLTTCWVGGAANAKNSATGEAFETPFYQPVAESSEKAVSLATIETPTVWYQSYQERKSYRSYNNETIASVELSRLLELCRIDPICCGESANSLKILLFVKQNRVEGLEQGVYQWNPADNTLILINDSESTITVFNGSEAIYESAGIAIFIVKTNAPETAKENRDDALYLTGYIGQSLMNGSTFDRIGLCAIGIVNVQAATEALQLQSGEEVLHSFLGGKVEQEVIERFEIFQESQQAMMNPQEEIQEYLKDRLPHYMIPKTFVLIDSVPLTANGKVNRKALPAVEVEQVEEEILPLETETEEAVAQVWKTILQRDAIGRNQNFFEVGGNSLLLIRLSKSLNQQFNKDFKISKLFEFPTVQLFAEYLDQDQQEQEAEDAQKMEQFMAWADDRRSSGRSRRR